MTFFKGVKFCLFVFFPFFFFFFLSLSLNAEKVEKCHAKCVPWSVLDLVGNTKVRKRTACKPVHEFQVLSTAVVAVVARGLELRVVS